MKKFLAFVFVLFCTASCFAYDFSGVAPSGQTIYFRIIGEDQVALTYQTEMGFYINPPTGELVLPTTAVYQNKTYTLTAIGDYALVGCKGLTGTITIPSTVLTIGEFSFASCINISEFILHDKITSIGYAAFQDCVGWNAELKLPGKLQTIGDYAFYNCLHLHGELKLPNTLTYIGSYAFKKCDAFVGTLVIPENITTIYDGAFSTCTGLTEIVFKAKNCAICGSSKTHIFENCSNVKTLTISESCEFIPNNAFYNLSGLETLYFNSITCTTDLAGYSHFTDSPLLSTIVIGDKVQVIPTRFFYKFTNEFELSLPQSIKHIEDYAFNGCTGMKGNINFTDNLQTIGQYAFSECSQLTGDVNFGNNLTKIGPNAFENCNKIGPTVTIGRKAGMIELLAFKNCVGIKNVVFNAEGNCSTGVSAMPIFQGCTGIRNVRVGSFVTKMPNNLFRGLSSITTITAGPSTPPTAVANVFQEVPTTAKLYVNCGATDAYQEANVWKNFSVEEEMFLLDLEVTVNDNRYGTAEIVTMPTQCGETAAKVKATPKDGGLFAGWYEGEDLLSTDLEYSFQLTKGMSLVAHFGCQFEVVAVSSDPTIGTVAGGGLFDAGTTCTVSATPKEDQGARFVGWYEGEDLLSTDLEYSFIVEKSTYLTGVFDNTFEVTILDAIGGFGYGEGSYPYGTEVTVSVVADDNFSFLYWLENSTIVSEEENYTFIIDKDRVLLPVFTTSYTITLSAEPAEGGIVEGEGTFLDGTVTSITATPNAGYKFVRWLNDLEIECSTNPTMSVIVDTDKHFTAIFEKLEAIDENTINAAIYPNPAKGQVNIKAISPIQTIEVYNAIGQKIMLLEAVNTESKTLNLNKGTYFVRIITEQGSSTQTVIVE